MYPKAILTPTSGRIKINELDKDPDSSNNLSKIEENKGF